MCGTRGLYRPRAFQFDVSVLCGTGARAAGGHSDFGVHASRQPDRATRVAGGLSLVRVLREANGGRVLSQPAKNSANTGAMTAGTMSWV